MLKGIYTAASGITAAMIDSDVTASNLANLGTSGFKKVGVNYAEFGKTLMNRLQGGKRTEIGSLDNGVQVVGTQTAFIQGLLKTTGNPLDVALDGEGFFTVQNATTGEKFYTRNGAFTQNAQGVITTQEGMPLLNEQGKPITIPQGSSSVTISNSGLVSAMDNQGTSQVLGQLQITQIENPETLESKGAYLYTASNETRIDPNSPGNLTVVQGALEASNVNVVEELIKTITGSRRYESLQKSIRMQDKTLEQAVTQVGRYR